MVEPNHIHARQDFARRLRELRVPRGFKTARSLARALEIDENRYTRYERAEVEPDLALIRRICETLRVTPNELLGTPSAAAGSTSEPAGGLPGDGKAAGIDDGPRSISLPEGAVTVASPFSVRVDTAAWSLACAVAELKDGARADGAVQSLAVIQRATHFYQGLKSRPFEAIGEIVRDPTVTGAQRDKAQHVCSLIAELTAALRQVAQPE